MSSLNSFTFNQKILGICLISGLLFNLGFCKTVTGTPGPCEGENCPNKVHHEPVDHFAGDTIQQNVIQDEVTQTENQAGPKEETLKQQEDVQNVPENEQLSEDNQKSTQENLQKSEEDQDKAEEGLTEIEEATTVESKEHESGTSSQHEQDTLSGQEENDSQSQRQETPLEIGKEDSPGQGQDTSSKEEEEPHSGPGHSIDPEAFLHPGDSGHTQGVKTPAEETLKFEPNAEKQLHEGVDDVHEHRESQTDEIQNQESSGPHPDAVLHGGDKHIHESRAETAGTPDNDNAQGQFGVDPEGIMHNEAHVHDHKEPRGLKEGEGESRDYATDVDALLHAGEKHIHSSDMQKENKDEVQEVPIGATDPEALMHHGDRHVHSHSDSINRNDQESRQFGAQDPESVLHGSDSHGHTVQQQALDGSRPLSGSKDPDEATIDVNPEEVTIGTMTPEDAKDYRQWKTEKKEQAETKDSPSWISGFSYLTDAIWRDLKAVKKRYLEKFWGDDDTEAETFRTIHDEP